ncbi:MAG: Serine O-acetyltransferase [Thermoproteota archaeon]|nr:Serine O-acetyltransferase [Thermoproteota archaeon]
MSGGVKVEKKQQDGEAESYAWTPEQSLEMMLKGLEVADNKWVESGLPKLVDEIAEDYEKYGGINHIEGRDLPLKQAVIGVLEDLLTVVFPGYLGKAEITKSNTKYFLGNILNSIHSNLVDEVEKSLKYACRRIKECPEDVCLKRAHVVVKEFLQKLPEIRTLVRGDIQAAYYGDPAAKSIDEVILSYPCVLAIGTYRVAHELHVGGVPLVPRIMSEYAHSITGIDIHPGAKIGRNFFIDHGTGVVIGETTEIGENVKLYQGVTLGALSFPKDERGRIIKGRKRHPTIGNNVIIYSGATILGGKTVIGDDAVVGGNVWITSSIPAGIEVTITPPELHYKKNNLVEEYTFEI